MQPPFDPKICPSFPFGPHSLVSFMEARGLGHFRDSVVCPSLVAMQVLPVMSEVGSRGGWDTSYNTCDVFHYFRHFMVRH